MRHYIPFFSFFLLDSHHWFYINFYACTYTTFNGMYIYHIVYAIWAYMLLLVTNKGKCIYHMYKSSLLCIIYFTYREPLEEDVSAKNTPPQCS